ncbi:glycosyltransferase family protein [Cochleicola gelatinilyticus]|uniref:Glycosyltransferase RgtA/B/C/D-like domain-containing protein n=1 Tax=Cochleicola gelatinilyticus TaxID=1763537 RepID=A0A167KER0_9FLAO|nr:hypothetical protein [Cochleicola gelatinilyticus]OAB81813.1 hypothetical protein ULVI_00295 [Cochleicola gelatinilyticus]
MSTKAIRWSIALLGLIPLVIWGFRYINYDLWYDEVYSLEHFALTEFDTTMYYYPAPNNHIFFNLTSQLISRIFQYRDIFVASDHVYIFRALQVLVTMATGYYGVLFLKRFFNFRNNYLLLVILFTTIPFMNFSLQLRGYNMSSLFTIMLLYYAWRYLKEQKRYQLMFIGLSVLLLLYTIPSNLYVVASVGLLVLVEGWYRFRRKEQPDIKHSIYALVSIAIGILIAFMLYFPILEDVIFNKYSSREAYGWFHSFFLLLKSIPAFTSNRYLLVLLIVPGVFYFFTRSTSEEKQTTYGLITFFVLPFFLSFIHQKAPFARVFITQAPIFALLVTIFILYYTERLKKPIVANILWVATSVYCIFMLVFEMNRNDAIIAEEQHDAVQLNQGLYRNFYLADFFEQDKTIQYLKGVYKDAPVVFYDQEDRESTAMYLRKYDISFQKIDAIEDLSEFIKTHKEVYVLTAFKTKTLTAFEALGETEIEVLTPEYSFTNILKLTNNKTF